MKDSNFNSFIFTHIPKCGGTSFRKYVLNAAKKSKIPKSEIYIPGFLGVGNRKNIFQLNDAEKYVFYHNRLKVIGMHSYNDVHTPFDFDMRPFYFTILREPISRYLSHYFFFNYRNGVNGLKNIHPNNLDVDFFKDLTLKHGNVLTKYLAHIPLNETEVSESDLKKAQNNLRQNYSCFGLMDEMHKSLDWLRKTAPQWLNFPEGFYSINVNNRVKINQRILDDEKMSIVLANNSIDIKLYQYAQDLFHKKTMHLNRHIEA